MNGVVLSTLCAVLLAGCLANDPTDPGDADPFSGQCDFPQVPESTLGGNTAYVGGVADFEDRPIAGVEVMATPQDRALEPRVDTTNDSGCYYLSLEPDVVYDITWAHDDYLGQQLDAVQLAPGEKEIRHVFMKSR